MFTHSLFKQFSVLVLISVFLLLAGGCSDDPAAPPEDDPVATSDIHTDLGSIGTVIDTRQIFKKGYLPSTAEVTFPNQSRLNTTLDVNQTTNLAILSLRVEDLTEAELAAFEAGVPIEVVINDVNKAVLATHNESQLVLDDSNTPLELHTSLPFIAQPVVLQGDMPYLMQVEGSDNVVSSGEGIAYLSFNSPYVSNDPSQQFIFTPVPGSESTYTVTNSYYGEMLNWTITEGGEPTMILDHDHYLPLTELVLEQDEEGWIAIRLGGTQDYIQLSGPYTSPQILYPSPGVPSRFRLICDDINWNVSDRGTIFEQPIMSPAELDFAYEGELINCGPGELTDSIGTSEERSWEETVGLSDSFELFSSNTSTLEIEVGLSVSASIGVDIQGIGEASTEVEVSSSVTMTEEFQNSTTAINERNWSQTKSGSKSVSRTRDYVVPPYSGVKVRDAIKTVRDVRVPFTQVLRITATKKVGGRTLSGEEIRSQMLFNFVGGVIKAVGEEYVDIGLRGYTVIDQMFQATTVVTEIEGACD